MKTTELFSRNILSSMAASVLAIALVIATVLTASSCAKEFVPTDAEEIASTGASGLTFSATIGEDTKTSLAGTRVHWTLNDEIALWYGALGTEMTPADYFVGAVDGSDARKATLYGFAEESADYTYLAVYPRSASVDCSKKGKLTVAIPSVQNLKGEDFDPDAAVSVAVLEEGNFSFRNVGSLMALQVNDAGGHCIKEIRLAGTSALSGEVEIKKDDLPAVSAVTDGTNYAVLYCAEGLVNSDDMLGANEHYTIEDGIWDITPEGNEGFGTQQGEWDSTPATVSLSSAADGEMSKAFAGFNNFYLVTLPGSHKNFSITLVDDQGRTAVAKSTNFFTIERNGNTLIAKIAAPTGEWSASPKVFINEIHTHNNQIELWNPNDFSVDLTGWLLVKDEKSWAFPVGSTIPAKGYKVITAGQTDCASGPMFGISGDKGFVLSLVSGTTVDCIDNSGDGHAVIGTTETYGRKTDGSPEWVTFINDGTIYESGVCDGDNSKGVIKGDEPATASVVLNEINGNDKYVELYNRGAETVDITGWTLHKDDSKVWTANDESQLNLAPGAYMVINFVKKSTDPKEAASGLSAGKTVKVELKDKEGHSIDVFTRGEESTGWGDIDLPEHEEWSFNRVPNGTGAWKYAIPTKGAENGPATGTIEQYPAANGSVVLNELNGNDKFIELYNTSTDYAISLEDMTLYKDDGTDAVWTGAPGYAVAPGGYVLLYSEDVIDKYPGHDSGLVFTSGLSPKKTLKIELKDAAGVSADIFTRGTAPWGGSASSCANSFGRTPDGTGAWQLTDKTPGTANGDSKGDIPQN